MVQNWVLQRSGLRSVYTTIRELEGSNVLTLDLFGIKIFLFNDLESIRKHRCVLPDPVLISIRTTDDLMD